MLTALAAVFLSVAACGIDDPLEEALTPTTTTATGDPDGGDRPATSTRDGSDGVAPTTTPAPDEPPPRSLTDPREAAARIQQFWQEAATAIGLRAFRPLADDRIIAVDSRSDLVICDGERLPFAAVEDNAMAVPCQEGTAVLYDVALFAELTNRFGGAAPTVVLAHEWGHVAQFQAGISSTPVIVEQQADCFAGAWVAWAVARQLPPFDSVSTLDSVLAAVVFFRDEPGVSPVDVQAHGSGFDRVRAFQEGFESGVSFCAGYLEAPPLLVQLPFAPSERATGGNLGLTDALSLMTADLERFFGRLVPALGPLEPGAAADADELRAAHREVGDNGVGLLLSLGWSEAAQRALGADTEGDGALLERACLAGAWMGELLDPPEDAKIRLSPGDLDEAVITFIERRGQAGGSDDLLAFELVASLRLGVTDGIGPCGLT